MALPTAVAVAGGLGAYLFFKEKDQQVTGGDITKVRYASERGESQPVASSESAGGRDLELTSTAFVRIPVCVSAPRNRALRMASPRGWPVRSYSRPSFCNLSLRLVSSRFSVQSLEPVPP